MAKMQNVYGFNPHQLFFGQNPNLPSVLTYKPPAWEGSTRRGLGERNLSALHASRKAFTENTAYYEWVDCPEWTGPQVIIGRAGAAVFVRHGGTCFRAHHLRLRKVNADKVELGIDDDTGNRKHTPQREPGENTETYRKGLRGNTTSRNDQQGPQSPVTNHNNITTKRHTGTKQEA